MAADLQALKAAVLWAKRDFEAAQREAKRPVIDPEAYRHRTNIVLVRFHALEKARSRRLAAQSQSRLPWL